MRTKRESWVRCFGLVSLKKTPRLPYRALELLQFCLVSARHAHHKFTTRHGLR